MDQGQPRATAFVAHNITRIYTVDRYLHTGSVGMRFQFGIEPSNPFELQYTTARLKSLHSFLTDASVAFFSPLACVAIRTKRAAGQGLSGSGAPGVASGVASAVPAPGAEGGGWS